MIRKIFRKTAAVAGAIAIALVGVSTSGALAAGAENKGNDDVRVENIGTYKRGSVTVFKKGAENDEAAKTGDPKDKKPLQGITFKIEKIKDIDLTKVKGWKDVAKLTAADVKPERLDTEKAESAVTNYEGKAKFDRLPLGAYLVTETSIGKQFVKSKAEPFIVTIPRPKADNMPLGTPEKIDGWEYDVVAYPKNVLSEQTQFSKKAVAVDGLEKKTEVEQTGVVKSDKAGAKITWELAYDIPDLAEYTELTLVDTLPAGATHVTESLVLDSVMLLHSDYERTEADGKVTFKFTSNGLAKLKAGMKLTAKIETTHVDATGNVDNSGELTINGNKFTSKDSVYFQKFEVTKQDATSQQRLAGAKFDIYDDVNRNKKLDSADRKIGSFVTPKGGVKEMNVYLGRGDSESVYRTILLKETEAPAGYLLPSDAVTVVELAAMGEPATAKAVIDNYKPLVPGLPLTGASGIVTMSAIGVGLLGIGAFAVRQSRKARQGVED